MANPSYPTNDANSVQNWEKGLYRQVVYRSPLSSLIGDDENAIIQLKKEPAKNGGDNTRYNILTKLTGDGIGEGETATGNGETASVYQDSLIINELLHLVTNPVAGRNIIDQRVPWDLRDQAKSLLATWWAERKGRWFFNHMCGYTPANTVGATNGGGVKYTGFNTVVAPTRKLFSAGSAEALTTNSADESLAAGDDFKLELLDAAVELAITDTNPIRPINIKAGRDGSDLEEPKFVCYMHPRQETQLRNSSGSMWKTIELAAMQGGNVSKSPIYTGALGEYRNVILRRAVEVTPGVNSSTGASIANVRRAVLLGAQAAGYAFGKNNGENSFKWHDELIDHDRWVETSAMAISGMKKMRYTIGGSAVDAGVMTLSSYSPASA
jgi:N4-gp56 family major capsid protein